MITLSKLLGKKNGLPIPELVGKVVVYREIKDGKILQEGEKEIEEAYIQFSDFQIVIRVLNDYAEHRTLGFDNYKAFLLGEYLENYAVFYAKFYWKLKSPSLSIDHIEREVKRQRLIRKILTAEYEVKQFFKRISPAILFLLKCIIFALTLKLIL